MMRLAGITLAAGLLAGCTLGCRGAGEGETALDGEAGQALAHRHEGGEEHTHGTSNSREVPSHAITHWTPRTELFVEFPVLVRNRASQLIAHLTRLEDFRPLEGGKVVVVLSGGSAPEEVFAATQSPTVGVFRPVVRPMYSGIRKLVVGYMSDNFEVSHDLGDVEVFSDADAARRPESSEGPSDWISFSKEQQWRILFGTEAVTERVVRASIPVHGEIRARPDGEVRMTAPVAGRVLTAGKEFPRIGARVSADHLLVSLAPQLVDHADLATLELALAEAQLDANHAERERERIEGLHREGAVAERRVHEARHKEAGARARTQAAKRRLAHFRDLQRPDGAGARGIEIRTPIAGSLVAVNVTAGAFVSANQEMFHIVDLRRLWVETRVPEANLGRLADTSGMWFEVDGYDRIFEVTSPPIARGGVVDRRSRTVPFVWEFENPDQELHVGTSVRAHLLTAPAESVPTVRATAVISDAGEDTVYVQVSGEKFIRRVVRLGGRDGSFVRVISGLSIGERVVARGAYALRLASSAGQVPDHGHAH